MKLNLKNFDAKQFFIQHVEKLVLGLFLLGFGWLVWVAVGVEPYKKTPDQLTQQAQQVQSLVSGSNWLEFRKSQVEKANEAQITPADPNAMGMNTEEEIPLLVEDYLKVAKGAQADIDFSLYATREWDPVIIPPKQKRSMPKLFELEQLRLAYGQGAFSLRDEQKQLEEEGRNPRGDTRERPRERRPRPKPKKPKRDNEGEDAYYPNDPLAGLRHAGLERYRARQRRAGRLKREDDEPREGSEPEFANPYYGMGLGQGDKAEGYRWVVMTGLVPLAEQQREFFESLAVTTSNLRDQDIVHFVGFRVQRAEVKSEDQPLSELQWEELKLEELRKEMERWAEVSPELVRESAVAGNLCSALPPLIDREWDYREVVHPEMHDAVLEVEDVLDQAQAQLKKKEEEANGQEDPEKPRDSNYFNFASVGLGSSLYAEEYDRRFAETQLESAGAVANDQEYRMFRFFDFKVEPRKKYRYRVQLVMRNPNYKIPAKFLEDPTLAEKEFIECPWSEPSKVIEIPDNSHILASSAKPAMVTKDGNVNVMIRQWNKRQGVNAAKKFEVSRGEVANFRQQEAKIITPGSQNVQTKLMNFVTDSLLVDFTGGAKIRLRGRAVEPARTLFMTEDGRLRSYEELEDRVALEQEVKRMEESSDETRDGELFPSFEEYLRGVNRPNRSEE